MPNRHRPSTHKPDADELPTLDTRQLSGVTGGAGMDMMSMLPILMMMKGKQQPTTIIQAAPQPAAAQTQPALWTPRIVIDGVEQKVTTSSDGLSFSATSDDSTTSSTGSSSSTSGGSSGSSTR